MRFPNLQILRSDKIDSSILDEIITNYGGTIFHEKKLNELISSYYGTEFYYLVDDTVYPKILSPLHIEKSTFKRKITLWPSFDIPYGGFIGEYRYDLNLIEIELNESFSYAGIPVTDFAEAQNTISAPKLTWQETSMVDLSESLDTIFNHVINSKRRNMIRKAEKSGIKIELFDTVEETNDFFILLNGLHKRLGYEVLKPGYYLDLFQYYIPKNKAKLFVAYKDNIPLSGVMLIGNRNFMHYYKGCAANNVKNEGQGELLQWEAIKWAKSIGSRYYDLCGLNKDRLPHLYIFKTGISNKIYYYPISSRSGLVFKIINKIQKTLKLY